MGTAGFLYNLCITIAFAIDACIFLLLYIYHRRHVHLWIAVMFALFVVDNLFLYMDEFLPSFSTLSPSGALLLLLAENLTGLAITFVYRMILLADEGRELGEHERVLWFALLAIYAILSLLSTTAGVRIVVSLLRSTLPLIVIIISLYHRGARDDARPATYVIGTGLLWLFLALQIADDVERFFAYLGFGTIIPGRFLFIEVFSCLAILLGTIYGSRYLLKLSDSVKENVPIDLMAGIDDFGSSYGLTEREQEILVLVVRGLSNAQIAQELFISEGTAKTHVHNIYRKIGVSGRLQLMNTLSEFQKDTLDEG